MADSQITVSGLQAVGGANQIALAWNPPNDPNRNGLPYLRLAAIEVFAGGTNNRDAATKVGESSANSFTHLNVARAASFYYWIKPRDQSGLYGDWFPASRTGGVLGRETNVNALLQGNGFFRYADGRVEEWGLSQSANTLVEGETHDGVIAKNFQTTFSQIFGLHGMAITRSDLGGQIVTFPIDQQVAYVALCSVTTTGFVMRVIAPTSTGIPAPINGSLVYWRAYGI